MTVNEALRALVDELEAGDVPAPLSQPLTLAAVWCDLCRLTGEEPPADVVATLDAPVRPVAARRVRPAPRPVRGVR